MALPNDPDPKLAAYAHPERLVTTTWLAEHLGEPGLVVVESDEDVLLYDVGHIPGAVKVDWHTELNDPVTRDYVDGAGFARLCGERGITRETTVVFYGDRNNWWATYALWVFSLFGHPDVRILDGGRAKWVAEGREMTTEVPKPEPVDYPVVDRDDATIRAFKDDVLAHLGRPLVDVRSPGEYSGELLHMPDYPQEGAVRGGHIPGAAERPVGPGGGRGRDVQDPPGAGGHLPAGAGAVAVGRRRGVLPHRRALQPHLVRAHAPARLREGAQLRRQLDGVGQHRARADRRRAPSGVGAGPMTVSAQLPPQLAELVDEFAEVGPRDRLQLLLELSQELPELPERYMDAMASMEQVPECQSPLFLAVEVEPAGDRRVHLFFSAPREAPTTRGFASILRTGLDGEPAADVLAVPDDFYVALGLGQAVSPLRLRGMSAMLARIKNKVRTATAA